MKQLCLGYDIRTSRNAFLNSAHASNQNNINFFDGKFLSADPNIWLRPKEVTEITENRENLCNPLTLITNINILFDICSDLDQASNNEQIALTCFEPAIITLIEYYGPGWFEEPLSGNQLVKLGWQLIGFDVVDLRGLITGLSYFDKSKTSDLFSSQRYKKLLNSTGLFSKYELALEFAVVRGTQIPSHAPYVPVGILVKAI